MSFHLLLAEELSREGGGSPGVGLLPLPVRSRDQFISAYPAHVTCVSAGLGVCSSFC